MFWETHNNHNYVYINNAPIYFFLRGPYSLVTHVTVIRSSRRFTFANHFGIRCSNTRRRISGPRKLCFHVWPTCSTVSLRRKRKSDPLHRKSSSQDFARKRVNSGFIIDIYLIYVQQSFFLPCAEEFDNYIQQDAHEFLNFLINHINEIILAERTQTASLTTTAPNGSAASSSFGTQKKSSSTPDSAPSGATGTANSTSSSEPTWVHEIFQGILTSETRCLNCETVSSKDEHFFDLQVDIDQNTSITHCLRCFSNTETLCSDNKFKCDNCCSYQEAQKRMRVKKLPMILALHLKRFKYMEQYNRHIKVSHRVVFPLELRLFNTVGVDTHISIIKENFNLFLFPSRMMQSIQIVCMI